MSTNLDQLKNWMKAEQVDLAYISDPHHIAYFTGFHSEPNERILALFVPLNGEPLLFTPALEIEAAKNSPWNFAVDGYLDSQDPWKKIADNLTTRYTNLNQIAVEKLALPLAHFEAFKEHFPKSHFSKDVTGFIQLLQVRKTDDEIEKLKAAGKWADVALEIGFNALKEGVTEQEVIAKIEYELKKQGVAKMSFDTLVLFGDNAANPHGTPGNTKLKKGDFALFDLGVIWNGYCSDVTRTVAFGEPSDFQKEIYNLVLAAQHEAIAAIKPGITAEELDKVARDVISNAGYGKYFNHRLGHGIGTTVHEFPSLTEGNTLELDKGMCFSIEPGVYIPGKVGVRIEDCFYVTNEGGVPFTHTPKALKIIEA